MYDVPSYFARCAKTVGGHLKNHSCQKKMGLSRTSEVSEDSLVGSAVDLSGLDVELVGDGQVANALRCSHPDHWLRQWVEDGDVHVLAGVGAAKRAGAEAGDAGADDLDAVPVARLVQVAAVV